MAKTALGNVYKWIKKVIKKAMDIFMPDPQPAAEGEAYCTTDGMWRKTFFHGGMIFVGLLGYFIVHYIFVSVLRLGTVTIELAGGGEFSTFSASGSYSLSWVEWLIYLITSLSISLTPAIRYIPFGQRFIDTLYCISVGYNTSFAYWSAAQKDIRIAIVTLLISLVLCAIPYILFKYKHLVLPPVFAKIVYAAFWVLIMGGTIFGTLSSFPGIGPIADFFYRLYNLPGAGEFLLVTRIIIYFLFIFLCLDKILSYTNNKVPKEFEWVASFNLIYTITLLINWCLTYVIMHIEEIVDGIYRVSNI